MFTENPHTVQMWMGANPCITLAQPLISHSAQGIHTGDTGDTGDTYITFTAPQGDGSFARHDLRSHPRLKTTALRWKHIIS